MTASTKTIFTYTVVAFAAITLTAYIAFKQGSASSKGETEKKYKHDMQVLQKQRDSLSNMITIIQKEDSLIRLSNDTLDRRYNFLRATLMVQNEVLNVFRKKNLDLSRIGKFTSDSLKNYFNTNFSDTTKTQ